MPAGVPAVVAHAPHLRWGVLGGLLLLEAAWITIRFSVPDGQSGWPARLAAATPDLLRVGIAACATLAIAVGTDLRAIAQRLRDQPGYGWWLWGLLHALAFVVLVRLTALVFGGGASGGGPVLLAWSVVAGATFAFWLFALAPLRFWSWFAGAYRVHLAVSACVGVVAWLGGLLAQRLWRPLAEATLAASHALLTLVYPDVFHDSTAGAVGTHAFVVDIAPQCSGYEGIALVTVFVAVYLWIFRGDLSFPAAFLLLPLGIAAIWGANVLRVTALIIVGTSVSADVAADGFHSQAGWISFTLVALGLIAVSHRALSAAAPGRGLARSATGLPLAAPLLAPLLTMLAASMLGAAFSAGFDALYAVGVVATGAVLWHFRGRYRGLFASLAWEPVAIGAAVFALWLALEPAGGPGGEELERTLAALPPWLATLWIAFRLVGSVVTVPIAEELAFRGYLIRKLVSREFEQVSAGRFTWLSFLATSLLFGLLHERVLAGTLAGAAFAIALYRRGRVGDAIVAHVTSNALIAVAVLFFGRWSLWA